jgi:hypothetical protein
VLQPAYFFIPGAAILRRTEPSLDGKARPRIDVFGNDSGDGIAVIPLCQGKFFRRNSAAKADAAIGFPAASIGRATCSIGASTAAMDRGRPARFANVLDKEWAHKQSRPHKKRGTTSAPVCVRPCEEKSSENFILTQRYDRYTIAAVISMRVRFESERSSAMRAKYSGLPGFLKMKTRRAIGLARPPLRRMARVEKARGAPGARDVRRSAGRFAAKVEVQHVKVRLERRAGAPPGDAGIASVRGKEFAPPAGSRGGSLRICGSQINVGKGAMRVAVRVGGGKLVIAIVQMNLKQGSCN